MIKPAVFTPISEILVAYWKSDRWALLIVAAIVLLSSVANVAAPYFFSRLIDQFQQEGEISALVWGFVVFTPCVEYSLTDMGAELAAQVEQITDWIEYNLPHHGDATRTSGAVNAVLSKRVTQRRTSAVACIA